MCTVRVRLPESLHQRARELARKEGISIDQLVATALAEKISALDTVASLEARAERASREAYLEALHRTPSGPSVEGDGFSKS